MSQRVKITVKPEFKDKVVGYNGRSLPLGKRKDLDVLARIAKESGDKSLLMLFEEVPTQEQITSEKASNTVKAIRKATAKPAVDDSETQK